MRKLLLALLCSASMSPALAQTTTGQATPGLIPTPANVSSILNGLPWAQATGQIQTTDIQTSLNNILAVLSNLGTFNNTTGAFTPTLNFAGAAQPYFPGLSANVEGVGGPGMDMPNCTSIATCTFFMYAIPSAYPYASNPTLRIDKHFPANNAISPGVVTSFQVNGYTGANDAAFIWNNQSILYDQTLVSLNTQDVATAGTVFKQLGNQPAGTQIGTYATGVYGECQDQTAVVNPTGACLGAEFDVSAAVGAGTDALQQRVALQIGAGIYNGNDAGVHFGVGLLFGVGQGATMDRLIETHAGSFGIGLDTTLSTFSGPVLMLAGGQKIAFDGAFTGAYARSMSFQSGFLVYTTTNGNVFQMGDTGNMSAGSLALNTSLTVGGAVKFGTYTASAASPTGYITITDSAGTTRHLAVVP